MSNINWEKSYFLTADQVALLGLEGISVNDKENQDAGTTQQGS